MTKRGHEVEADAAELMALGITEHDGWIGPFTTKQADGAYPNKSRVEKVLYERNDTNPIGTLGTVLGSVSAPGIGIAYFIEWDSFPKHAFLVTEKKVKLKP